MGKSTVAAMFEGEGVPVFDADAAVRALQGRQGRLLPAIEMRFPGTTRISGVDRAALGRAVLGNPTAMRDLEAIVHPAVASEQAAFLRRNRARDIVVLDIPLLLEKTGWRHVDAIVVVSAPAWKQRHRVMLRAGMTFTKFRLFNAMQMPDTAKKIRADWIIDTGRAKGQTLAAVRHLLSCIRAGSA